MRGGWFAVPWIVLAACTSDSREFGQTSTTTGTGTGGASTAVSAGVGGEMASSAGVGAGPNSGGGSTGGSGGSGGSSPCGPCGMGLHCDPNLGCVDCLTSDDCMPPKGLCLLGSCVQCVTNADCDGFACAPKDHVCLDACPPCGDPNAPLCSPNGSCVACMGPNDCGGSKLCSPTFGQCVECIDNGNCLQNAPVCDKTTELCVGCVLAKDCKAPMTCIEKSCQ